MTTIKLATRTRDRLKTRNGGRFRTINDFIDHLLIEDERRTRMTQLAEAIKATPANVMDQYRHEADTWSTTELADQQS